MVLLFFECFEDFCYEDLLLRDGKAAITSFRGVVSNPNDLIFWKISYFHKITLHQFFINIEFASDTIFIEHQNSKICYSSYKDNNSMSFRKFRKFWKNGFTQIML